MAKGMVLVMSIWDDHAANMLWLDSNYPTSSPTTQPGVARGPCATSTGVPSTVESQYGSSYASFGNIKFGTIGSTVSGSGSTVIGGTTTTAGGTGTTAGGTGTTTSKSASTATGGTVNTVTGSKQNTGGVVTGSATSDSTILKIWISIYLIMYLIFI